VIRNTRLLSAPEMRVAFDMAFAAPAIRRQEGIDPFLAVRLGGDPYAVRLFAIAGFAPARTIVAFPGAPPAMLGLAGLRGSLVPVYDLATLLGYPPERTPLRWFLVCGTADVVAFAFAELEGHLQVVASESTSNAEGAIARRHVRQVLHVPDGARAIIDVPSLIEVVEKAASPPAQSKEQ
jgi:chemotaxis signal transduction protein